ncbi:MAG TPA: hypothetical protein VEK84_19000 [Terriglobales bacterium]|nr:hypothetical protein [Terriglobales bacterium]
MDKAITSILLDAFVQRLRGRKYPELCELLGAPECEEVSGPDGKAYQVEFEAHWDDPRDRGRNLRVIVSIDDGTFRAAFRPITKSFIMAPDGSFVGEPRNES